MKKQNPFNLPDNKVQRWKDCTLEGQEYNFNHLDSKKHTYVHPNRDERYEIYFTFSHHVFTRGLKPTDRADAVNLYPYDKDRRIFDEVRFELSKNLPEIIENLPEQFCYHGGYSRYCSCKIYQEDGAEVQYKIIYRAWKKSGKMRFHIESAYPLDERLGKVKKVDFWTICHNLFRGKKLPKPPLSSPY